MQGKEIKKLVKEGYGKVASRKHSCCDLGNVHAQKVDFADKISKKIGYTDEDIGSVPEESNLGLGCGNPIALASLKEGDIVLDLGSGAGFDCFLASKKVASTGKVKELVGLNDNVFNRNLIIIEDIIDSGLTLQHVRAALEDLGSASIEIATLFLKPESFHKGFDIKYVGFSIPNDFIVGYGMDYEGYGRNLQDVYINK